MATREQQRVYEKAYYERNKDKIRAHNAEKARERRLKIKETNVIAKHKFCEKCGCETERYTYGECKPCKTARNKIWNTANKESKRVAGAVYRAENHEKIRASSYAWRKANPDKVKANDRAWKSANPDRVRAIHAASVKANPATKRSKDANRRARKLKVGGKLSRGLAKRLFELQKGKCACCGQPLGTKYHLDHIMPLALGGSNTDDNIQLLTPKCNSQKQAKHPIAFMQEKGFLL